MSDFLTSMACPVCEVIKRDLSDVARALERRKADKLSIRTGQATDLDLQIRALMSAKTQIEAQYLKHQKSCLH
jgi:hypothetical protein